MNAATDRALRVLILDDDAGSASVIKDALEPRCRCRVASPAEAANPGLLTREHVDVVVSGFWRRGHRPEVPVVLVVDDENRTSRPSGIFDLVDKPVDGGALLATVERAAKDRDTDADVPEPVVGSAPAFMKMLAKIDRMTAATAPIVLAGQSGTGKDILASRAHARSPRRNRPFVVWRPAARRHDLDAIVAHARGGTLYVDELTDLDADSQARLSALLETSSDVRVVAATRREVARAVRERHFSEELYFRLAPFTIEVPALRERTEDVVPLARWFLDRTRARNPGTRARSFTSAAEAALTTAPWPGNVRQLESVVEAAVLFAERERIDAGELATTEVEDVDEVFHAAGEICSIRTLTERYVTWVLARCAGDRRRAASLLGIDVSTLYRWQRKRA